MKKSLIAVAGLAVLSTSAYASKARMAALGQEDDGSFYINDQRNTFYNPAHYNMYNNFAIFEWGNDESDLTSATSRGTSNAEGGFARQAGNFIYGVYVGDDTGNQRNTDSVAAGLNDEFLMDNNRVTLSFAGDAGIKWGASLWYSKQSEQLGTTPSNTKELEGDTLGLRGGVAGSNWQAYAILDLKDEATGTQATGTLVDEKDTYEADTGILLGGTYSMNAWTFGAEYETSGFEVSENSNDPKNGTGETTRIKLGAGNTKKMGDKATFFWDVNWESTTTESKDVGSTFTDENKGWDLDLTVALEAKALSWLTLRGSVSQDILSEDEDTTGGATANTLETSGDGTTTVAAGATLSWGKLMMDAVISHNQGGTGVYNLGANTLSEVSVHYWF